MLLCDATQPSPLRRLPFLQKPLSRHNDDAHFGNKYHSPDKDPECLKCHWKIHWQRLFCTNLCTLLSLNSPSCVFNFSSGFEWKYIKGGEQNAESHLLNGEKLIKRDIQRKRPSSGKKGRESILFQVRRAYSILLCVRLALWLSVAVRAQDSKKKSQDVEIEADVFRLRVAAD